MHIEDVHRYMWSRVDRRRRLQIMIVDLTQVFEVHRDIIGEALLEMRATGRIKYVGCGRGKTYVYEISNPDTFSAGDRRDNLLRPRQPAWG